MYATVFLILVRQRRRARPPLTLCAQCRHKYAIYASVWPGALVYTWPVCTYVCACVYIPRCSRAYVYAKAARLYPEENHTRVTSRAYVYVCIVWRNVALCFLSPCIWTPHDPRVSSRGFFSCFEQPDSSFVFPPLLPPPPPPPHHHHCHRCQRHWRTVSFAFLSLRHNCCNLRSRVVDLTVDPRHGNL